MAILLIIDDDPAVLQVFRRIFQEPDLKVLTASSAEEGLALAVSASPDTIVLDAMLPDESGLEIFERIHRGDPQVPILMISASADSDTVIEAMKLGALDYLVKPLDFPSVRELVNRALEIRRLMHVPVMLSDSGESATSTSDTLVGRCAEMQEVYKAIGRVAAQNDTVLIRGESGTGKELIARAIYQHSPRKAGKFLAVNCAAIPETLLESELFGHERGAFTGAESRRVGKFEQCSGGTLFLDEIGDMTALSQSKVLRVLQEQKFERVGGKETIQTDVRIITATNRDLEQMVANGQFRPDLYYRLNGFTIHLPPLRDRGDDISILARHYLARYSRELGKSVVDITPEADEILRRYPWPGNVRQLQSVLRQAILHTPGQVLLADFLPIELRNDAVRRSDPEQSPGETSATFERFIDEQLRDGASSLYADAVTLLERLLLTRVLKHTAGNQSQAAKILGITRGSLRNKIRQLRITIGPVVSIDEDQDEDAEPSLETVEH
jgi:two-component system nitrogen regulation response regulator GlnG